MVQSRSMVVLRGLISLAVALLLLVGVPVALAAFVGWPLPTTIPTGDAMTQAMRTGVKDEFVVNTLAVIAWLSWAQLALAFVSETLAHARGRNPLQMPVIPGLQVMAARLVTGVVLLTAPLQPARAGAQPAVVPIVAEAGPSADGTFQQAFDPHPLTRTTSNGSTITATRAGPTVTVQRHDSYWAIAERTLGDGLRWREIHDLNIGRTMDGGHVIAAGDDTLRTGWQLILPSGASTTDPPSSDEVVVEAGDNLWSLSEERLAADLGREPTDAETGPYWSEVIQANEDRFEEPGNPSLIFPGQVIDLPAAGAAAGPSTPTADRSTPPAEFPPAASEPGDAMPSKVPAPSTDDAQPTSATRGTAESALSDPTVTADHDAGKHPTDEEASPSHAAPISHDDSPSDAPVAVVVGGLASVALAVGVKRLINKRRRLYAISHDRQEPAPPDPDQRAMHQTAVAMADEARLDDLQLVLGWLSVEMASSGVALRPRVVRHSSESLEVLLDRPSLEPPPGWTAEDSGLIWTLTGKLDIEDPFDGPMCPAPLLVTIGEPDEDAQIYLDLEVDGVVSLTGDIEVARDLARSILTELALAPMADTLRVIVIGDLVEPDASHLDHLTLVEAWLDIAEDLTAWVRESNQALSENGWPNTFVGRGHEPDHDALVPIAVIATKPPPPDLLAVLLEGRPSAVAIVVADEFEGAATSIHCDADTLSLDDVDLCFSPQMVDEDELEAMGRLLVMNDPQPIVDGDVPCLLAEEPAGAEGGGEAISAVREVTEPAVDLSDSGPPEFDVLVRLLGDIHVDGGTKQVHPKPTSVTAYLAIHRIVTTDRLEEACWFGAGGTSHRKRLRDVMTECRSVLGSHHFPANRDGTYKVGPKVRTDLELFDWHVSRAVDQDPDEAVESYRAALDLVTGKPFSYANADRQSFGWVDFEHHATSWELKISGVAKAYTELCIDLERAGEATGLLRRLAQATPLSSGVIEALMRAHAAIGDRSAVENLYQEHAKALEQADLGDPDEAVEQLRLRFIN